MAVVIDLDPLRRLGQFEEFGQFAVERGLGPALCQPPFERFDRVALGLRDQPPPVAALRDRQVDLASGPFAKCLGEQLTLGQRYSAS